MISQEIAGRYRVSGELGRGAMGVVYLAEDLLLGRQVAVKVLSRQHQDRAGTLERFQREARLIAQLEHPSIVPIYDFGTYSEGFFLIMPCLRGKTLRTLLDEKCLSQADILSLAVRIAGALGHSHRQGIVHRDIKPENIMIKREDDDPQVSGPQVSGPQVKVMDFGIAASQFESKVTEPGQLIGTLSYASPEQVSGTKVDGRCDIYSLGAVLYECVTGSPPFIGAFSAVLYKILEDRPVPPNDLGAGIDEAFEQIILSCLEKDVCDRPPTMAALAEALESYRSSQGPEISRDVPTRNPAVDRSSFSRDAALRAPPLGGRREELRWLHSSFRACEQGECRLVFIGGEPGVGKSRLLKAFEAELAPRGAQVLRGRFVERRDQAFPYQGFCDVLLQHLTERTESDVSVVGAPLSELAGDLICLFPALFEIPSLREARTLSQTSSQASMPVETPEGAPAGTATFELLSRAISAIREGRPLVLLLENLHDANISLDALQYIYRRLISLPILIVGTYRTNELHDGHRLGRLLDTMRSYSQIWILELEALSEEEHAELVQALLGSSASVDVLRSCYEVTEGNPYYTLEYVKALMESGALRRGDTGGWLLKSPPPVGEGVPPAIRRTVERRLKELTEAERELLEIASILGRQFEYEDLEQLAGRDIEQICDRLLRAGFFEDGQNDQLAFASALVKGVAYERLSYPRRRSLHRQFAREMESRFEGQLEQVYDELAHHYSAGNFLSKAVPYGLYAAQKALCDMNYEAVARSVKVVLKLVESTKWDGGRRSEAEARLLLAGTYRAWGNAEEALEAGRQATEIFELTGDSECAVAAALLATEIAWENRLIDAARIWFEKGRKLAREAGASEPLVKILAIGEAIAHYQAEIKKAESYRLEAEAVIQGTTGDATLGAGGGAGPVHQLGDTLFIRGEYEAAREAYEAARGSGAQSEASYLLKIGELEHKLGHYDEALGQCRRGIDLLGESDSLMTAAFESLAALVSCSAGRTREAESWIRDGLKHLEGQGLAADPRRARIEASLLRARGNFLVDTGRPDEAISAYRRCLELWTEVDDAWEISIALFNLGEALAGASRHQEALEKLDQAFQRKSELGDRWGMAYVHLIDARIRLDRGAPEEALERAREGLRLATEVGDPKIVAFLRVVLGRAELVLNDIGRAETEFHLAFRAASEAEAHLGLVQAQIGLARVNTERGRFALARRNAEEALAGARSSDSKEELAAALVALGDLDRLLGSFDRAVEEFQEALGLARRIGNDIREHDVLLSLARLDLARTDPEAARPHFEAILERTRETDDRYYRAQAHAGLAEAHFLCAERERALAAASAALTDFQAIGRPLKVASVYELLSRLHLGGEGSQAIDCARQAIEIYEQHGETAYRRLGRAFLRLGQAHHVRAEAENERESLQLARYYFSSAGDLAGLADSYRAMAVVLTAQESDKAVEIIRKSLRLAQDVGHYLGEAEAFGDLGEVYRRMGRLHDAWEAFRSESRVVERIGYLQRKVVSAYHLASVEFLLGRLGDAWQSIGRCTDLVECLGDLGLVFSLEFRARVALELGRVDDAWQDLDAALLVAQRLADPERLANVHRTRADAFLRLGDLSRARREIVGGLAAAARLPARQILKTSGHLVEERLTLLEVRTLISVGRVEAALEQARHTHANLTAVAAPVEEIEAELVICETLIVADRRSEAEQVAVAVQRRSRDLGLEMAHCDALLILASLRGDPALAQEGCECAEKMSSPPRILAARELLEKLHAPVPASSD